MGLKDQLVSGRLLFVFVNLISWPVCGLELLWFGETMKPRVLWLAQLVLIVSATSTQKVLCQCGVHLLGLSLKKVTVECS